jgi:hypothetical protein
LKGAVTLALAKVAKQLEDIKSAVKAEAEDVAARTLKKLKEFDDLGLTRFDGHLGGGALTESAHEQNQDW